jgi:hypothetical protein
MQVNKIGSIKNFSNNGVTPQHADSGITSFGLKVKGTAAPIGVSTSTSVVGHTDLDTTAHSI